MGRDTGAGGGTASPASVPLAEPGGRAHPCLERKKQTTLTYDGESEGFIDGSFQDSQQTTKVHCICMIFFLPPGNVKSLLNNYSLVQPKCFSSTYGLNSFSYNGPRLCNNLSNDLKRTSNVKIKTHLGK